MRNRNPVLLAVMVVLFTLTASAFAENITQYSDAEGNTFSVLSGLKPMTKNERFEVAGETIHDLGGEVSCQDNRSVLVSVFNHRAIGAKIIYVLDNQTVVVADAFAVSNENEEEFRRQVQNLCAEGGLQEFQKRVNETL